MRNEPQLASASRRRGEPLLPAAFFDQSFYESERAEAFEIFDAALRDFLEIGQHEGADPSPLFMWSWVRRQGGVAGADVRSYLFAERCACLPHPLLSRDAVPDDAVEGFGWLQRLSDWLLSQSTPLAVLPPAVRSALEESPPDGEESLTRWFEKWTSKRPSRLILRGLFDSNWYAFAYPDIKMAGVNAFAHFFQRGFAEARDPSPAFSTRRYLDNNADVASQGVNALLHYIHHGYAEGRATFDAENLDLLVRHQINSNAGPPLHVDFSPPDADELESSLKGMTRPALVIVVPFYKQEDLVAGVLGSLIEMKDELLEMKAMIVIVNDSPAHEPLALQLHEWAPRIADSGVQLLLISNERNRGFVYSSNLGIFIASRFDAHCLLLNSDTLVTPGSISEMLAVMALDEKFAFVNPRSNNATIATVGRPDRPLSSEESFENWKSVRESLRRFDIVPVVVGFCLLIRDVIIKRFGFMDMIYGHGYNDENDYIFRANRLGYVSVLANFAYVFHIGKSSFSLLEESADLLDQKNSILLQRRYPEFLPSIRKYMNSTAYRARQIVESKPDFDVIFDLGDLPALKNGTTKLPRCLLPHIFDRLEGRSIGVVGQPGLLEFLGVESPPHVSSVEVDEDATAGLCLRLSQPFSYEDVRRMSQRAQRIGCFMLDAIAMDCLYLRNEDLFELWSRVLSHASLVMFNSAYTLQRFQTRFELNPKAIVLHSDHSFDLEDYRPPNAVARPPGGRAVPRSSPRVLLFGNSFAHKGLRNAIDALRDTDVDLTVFGLPFEEPGLRSLSSGMLTEDHLEVLYNWCDIVVFPSFYEGFGFPVLEALARFKPCIVLDSGLMREAHARLGAPEALLIVETAGDIAPAVAALGTKVFGSEAFGRPRPEDGWSRSAAEIASGIERALDGKRTLRDIERRLSAFD